MNRNFKEYAMSNHQQRRRGTGNSDEDLHPLDLFSRNRPRVALDASDRLASLRLGKISVGSVKSVKSGLDDLLTSADSGKHDYDWLLTPPETPLVPSAEGNEFQQSFTTPRRSSATRSVSTSKPSRLSTTRVDSNVSSRPARSSSVTRSSVSHSQYSSIRSSSSILNTSSASVSSYIRPSSPITRSSSTTRPSTPSARTTPSRSSTPSRARSSPSPSSIDKPRPSYGSRPSSPISRPQIAATSQLTASRSSTPTRRSTITSSSSPGPNNNISASSVRGVINNGRSQTSGSRPSSPNPSRIRPQQSVIPPDYSHDTPPNLRTTLSDRPASAGRSRPVANATISAAKANSDNYGHGSFTRRASSPIVTRGRSVEPKGRSHVVHSNGYASEVQESRRSSYVPESPSRRNARVSTTTTTDSNVYGRTISKKSLDMAMKHMDARDGLGNTRPLGGTVRYPQSVRSATSKIHSPQTLSNSTSGGLNGRLPVNINNGFVQRSEYGKYTDKAGLENGRRREENGRLLIERLSDVDMFESARYDAILLKEDLKNTNWLLSADEKSDYGLMFDPGFEPLPEPFGLS